MQNATCCRPKEWESRTTAGNPGGAQKRTEYWKVQARLEAGVELTDGKSPLMGLSPVRGDRERMRLDQGGGSQPGHLRGLDTWGRAAAAKPFARVSPAERR